MSKVGIVYWSSTGNTEAMAQAVAEGAKAAGADVEIMEVADADADKALSYDVLALGCPAMGDEELEDGEFEPFFSDLEGNSRLSFGWKKSMDSGKNAKRVYY